MANKARQLSLEKTSMYYPSDTEELQDIGEDEEALLEDEPLIKSEKHTATNKKKKKYDKILCWSNPHPVAQVIWGEITRERIKIGIILIFVLTAACMFAFSHEENAEILSLSGIASDHPLVRENKFVTSKN